ncbi:MAG: nucleotide exchange factor GrpE [Gemmataceae bacterium]
MADKSVSPEANKNATESDNGANEAIAVLNDLEALRTRAEVAEQKRDEYLDLVKRTQADFENYQKRAQREAVLERKFAHASLAADLLPALDNLERATAAAEQAGDEGALVKGVLMVQAQLLEILKRHGVTPIDAQGKPFDPNLHQAVNQMPSAAFPPGSVIKVLEQGFMIHDRVLRPTRVTVSTAVS